VGWWTGVYQRAHELYPRTQFRGPWFVQRQAPAFPSTETKCCRDHVSWTPIKQHWGRVNDENVERRHVIRQRVHRNTPCWRCAAAQRRCRLCSAGVCARASAAASHRGRLPFSTATREAFALQGRPIISSPGFELSGCRSAGARAMSPPCQARRWMAIGCLRATMKARTHQCWSILPASPPQPAMIKATTVDCQLWQFGSSAFATARSSAVSLRVTSLGNPLTSTNDRQAPPQRTPAWHNTAWAGAASLAAALRTPACWSCRHPRALRSGTPPSPRARWHACSTRPRAAPCSCSHARV
jgi:hypothetical protein